MKPLFLRFHFLQKNDNEQLSAPWNARWLNGPECRHDCLMFMVLLRRQPLTPNDPKPLLQDHRAGSDKTRWPARFPNTPPVLFPLLFPPPPTAVLYSLATANGFSTSILPQSWMLTSLRGLSRPSVFVPSIFFTTSWKDENGGY